MILVNKTETDLIYDVTPSAIVPIRGKLAKGEKKELLLSNDHPYEVKFGNDDPRIGNDQYLSAGRNIPADSVVTLKITIKQPRN